MRWRRVGRVLAIAFLFGVAFWIVDGVLHYTTFRTSLRTMIFEPPGSLADAILFKISPYTLRVRLMFMAGCLVGGLIVAVLLDRQVAVTDALRASEERYRTLFEHSPEPIILLSPDGNVLDCNAAAMSFAEQQKSEVIGSPFWVTNALSADASHYYSAALQRMIAGEAVGSSELQIRTGSGELRWIEIFPKRLEKQGEPHTVLIIARDVHERKQAEEALHRLNQELEQRIQARTRELVDVNRELEAFAYSISHDLRAPLRSIDGFSRMLQESYDPCLDATGQDYLQRVRAACQRMTQMIDDVLKLSRTTRGDMVRLPVDLSAIAQQIVADLRAARPDRQVTITIAEGMRATGDARLLRLVLENLIGNAWKFTGKQPQATIVFEQIEREGEQVFCVRDDGPGFDMAYADRLFGVFQRLHSAAEFEGTGAGLAIVQRIIRRHAGRVWAEAAVGQGAAFYFTLASEDHSEAA